MPCYDGQETTCQCCRDRVNIDAATNRAVVQVANRMVGRLEAIICGFMTYGKMHPQHFAAVMDGIDWQEVGVSRSWVESWYAKHQMADEQRKQQGSE